MSTETTQEHKTLSRIEQALNSLASAGVNDYRVSVQRRPARIVVDQIS